MRRIVPRPTEMLLQNALVGFLAFASCKQDKIPAIEKIPGKPIREQTFTFQDSILGPVTFVPAKDESAPPHEQLKIYLKLGDGSHTKLPDADINFIFHDMDAVSFVDVDENGLTDIIIISQYISGIGPDAARPFRVAIIYLRRTDGFEFDFENSWRVSELAKGNLNIARVQALFTEVTRHAAKDGGTGKVRRP